MKFSVDRYRSFNEPFEGSVPWMYLDVKGLVTTGVGNLIEPVEVAMRLPWTRIDGTAAGPLEIRAEWSAIKADGELAREGYLAAKHRTSLRLTEAAINGLIADRLADNERVFRHNFAEYDTWPESVQLAVHSMAWAIGAGGVMEFTHLIGALRRRDWKAAAADCRIRDEGMRPLIARNAANEQLFAGVTEA